MVQVATRGKKRTTDLAEYLTHGMRRKSNARLWIKCDFLFRQLAQPARWRLRRIAQDDRGAALIEAVMGITILAALGVALMTGIRTANISGEVVTDKSVATKLARNQLEYVFSQPYVLPGGSYETLDQAQNVAYTVDTGYSVSADASMFIPAETAIERVVVTVTHGAKTILVLETLRSNSP